MAEGKEAPLNRRRAVMLTGGTVLSSLAPSPPAQASSPGEPQASPGIRFRQAGPGAIDRTLQEKAADLRDVRDYGVVADQTREGGGSDQTEKLLAIFEGLASDGFRGAIHIPYGVKFDVSTLYSRVPVGVTLYDDSSVNWGQPPAYRSRLRIEYSQDEEADDSQRVIASSHHPALMLMNFGTADSEAARSRRASLIHGIGQNHLGDPMAGWMMQFGRDQAGDKWNWGLRLQTPYSVGIANPQEWAPARRYSAGAYCIGHNRRIYRASEGGTSGPSIPRGRGAVSDGGVRWDYVQEALNVDRTVLDLREDGLLEVYGLAEGRLGISGGNHRAYHAVDAEGVVQWRDETRGLNIYTVTDAFGLRQGIAGSDHWLALEGATPAAPVTGAGKIKNPRPTIMSTLIPPEGRVTMTVVLRFDDSHTTLRGGSGFLLRGARDVTPASGSFITLKLDTTDTGAWREFHRSF